MPKAQVIVDVNAEEEVSAFDRWLDRWRGVVEVSEDEGCGCCVNIWQVSAPQEALDALPQSLRGAAPSRPGSP